jgi:hypothetical protein
MPLVEIKEKFTRSEMEIVTWRSQEQYWQMKQRIDGNGPSKKKRTKRDPEVDQKYVSKRSVQKVKEEGGGRMVYDDPNVEALPDRFFNEDGELDLSKVKGEEAVAYMNAQSKALNLPMFPVIRRMPTHG